MIDEWTFRWTTTRSPPCASARQIAWLPPDPPLTRNQLRRAPHASAASCWACPNGSFSGSGEVDDSGTFNNANEWLTRDLDSTPGTTGDNYTLTHDAAGNVQDRSSAPFSTTFVMRRATGGRWLNVAELPPDAS